MTDLSLESVCILPGILSMETGGKYWQISKMAHFWLIFDIALQNKINHWKNASLNKRVRHAMTFLEYFSDPFSDLVILTTSDSTIQWNI